MKTIPSELISGFSKLEKRQKINFISQFFKSPHQVEEELQSYWYPDPHVQQRIDEFSENTISNFHLPFSVAPNFLINGKMYLVPMVIEESSVVAAAANAAKYWAAHGGFHSEILGTKKVGQVHFYWDGETKKLEQAFTYLKKKLIEDSLVITQNMRKRGGGIIEIHLKNLTHLDPHYYQLEAKFETCDSMGANFINSCLETMAKSLREFCISYADFSDREKHVNVLMCILSNYTPECLVRTWVECPVEQIRPPEGYSPRDFAQRIVKGVYVAQLDPYRAATHNKGIFNGIDAVIMATGNDFRAIEANGHVYATRDGQYRSLSQAQIHQGQFYFSLTIPLAVGVVGGLTNLHPLVHRALELLRQPNAKELMMVASAAGLANNFSAVRSLVTTGIQKGHMKMHLMNILHHFSATEEQKQLAFEHFRENVISFNSVRDFIEDLQK